MDLKSKFCAKCGKSVSDLIDNLCAECFLEIHLIDIPKKTSIRHCTKCNSVWSGGLWVKASKSIEGYLLRRVIDKIKLPEEVEIIEANILKKGPQGKLKITLKLGDFRIVKEYNSQLIIERYCCPECSRERASSYLAIIQLRTNKDVASFVKKASKIVSRKTRIIKAEEQKQGIDLYVSSREVAMSLANEIKKKLNCRMIYSVKQYGWDRIRSKPLTKLTVLLREK